MIEVTDRYIVHGMPFEEYLAEPGYSNSFFKFMKPEVRASDGVRIGKIVDAIVFDDDWRQYEADPLFDVAMMFAVQIKKEVDISRAKTQVSLFAKFKSGNKALPVKGRADIIIGDLIVDLKVLDVPAHNLIRAINHFGYNTAMNGYCMMANMPHWALLVYSRRERRIVRYYSRADFDDVVWHARIRNYGYEV